MLIRVQAMGVLKLFSGRTLAERYLERGLFHLDKRKYEDALADLTAALGEEPFNAELYATRGFIYLESDREEYLEYARADFEYALHLNPQEWVAEYCLGMITYAEEAYDVALRHFTAARDLAHLHPEPYYYLGLCYYRLRDFDRAIFCMKQAFEIFEESGDSRKGYARRWKTAIEKEKKQLKAGGAAALPGGYSPTRTGAVSGGERPTVIEARVNHDRYRGDSFSSEEP
ncbi:MAG: tetratricopeptide repeat protein [Anaerolineae bacterium]|nr:tetratricopeptide repeat protein [Anaerolineae bacterium]